VLAARIVEGFRTQATGGRRRELRIAARARGDALWIDAHGRGSHGLEAAAAESGSELPFLRLLAKVMGLKPHQYWSLAAATGASCWRGSATGPRSPYDV